MSGAKRLLVAASAAMLLAAVPLAPATAASDSDCRIYGPDYVGEVVDCVIYVYTTAIG